MAARDEQPRDLRGAADLRARDVDRVWVMARVDEAFTDGQLTVDEHLDRLAAARAATTIRELDLVLRDLQVPVAPSAHRRGERRARVAVVVVAIAVVVTILAVAIAWFSAESVPDRPAAADDRPGAAAQVADRLVGGPMFSAAGLDEVVRATREKFGTTVIEGVHFYRDKAVVRVPEAVSPTGAAWYTYSLGGAFHDREVYGGQAVSSDAALRVDVARLDTRRLAELIASSPERLGLTGAANLSPNVPFRVTVGGDDGGQVWIGVNDIGIDSHLVAGLDGAILGVHRCGWGC
ncbi:DUF1707 domain-containing protein [Tsukamurella sp. M9C]|uniref:DUF1707 SHOCT-like domain-containing protein n=1 Tax=Tsukamurella sp. M9C TaxID=2877520 RepID=UPI001CD04045|nr:DUF1707 domain-containing protein [Tsukamurella sp. M9C]MCA0156251.1 DUF1707 domain-containing protein [Tsukamurella sp. M9C]